MNDLDELGLIERLDPERFLASVERFPEQIRDAHKLAHAVQGLPDPEGVDSIAILGMGGSGISGDVAEVVVGSRMALPIRTLKGYELPRWVGRNTLVFAASYSGDTEETLATFEEAAARRGARVVIITTGGEISRWGREFDIPIVEIPPGLRPRAALGYLCLPILVVCERLGLGPSIEEDVWETVDLIQRRSSEYGRSAPGTFNPAKRLARSLYGKIPIVYGSEGLAAVAAYRWKCQFNECSKVPAWASTFPELNHNEVVGWKELAQVTRRYLALVALRPPEEHPRIARRVEITLPLIQANLGLVAQVHGEGSSALARLFDLIYLGDFVATYLALLQGVDPAPTEIIKALKSRLSEPGG
jgi:glucose/mannose-6-phosphate isomerase